MKLNYACYPDICVIGKTEDGGYRIHSLSESRLVSNHKDIAEKDLLESLNSGSVKILESVVFHPEIYSRIPYITENDNMCALRLQINYFNPRYTLKFVGTNGKERSEKLEEVYDKIENGTYRFWNMSIEKTQDIPGLYSRDTIRIKNALYNIKIFGKDIKPKGANDYYVKYTVATKEEDDETRAKVKMIYSDNEEIREIVGQEGLTNIGMQIDILRNMQKGIKTRGKYWTNKVDMDLGSDDEPDLAFGEVIGSVVNLIVAIEGGKVDRELNRHVERILDGKSGGYEVLHDVENPGCDKYSLIAFEIIGVIKDKKIGKDSGEKSNILAVMNMSKNKVILSIRLEDSTFEDALESLTLLNIRLEDTLRMLKEHSVMGNEQTGFGKNRYIKGLLVDNCLLADYTWIRIENKIDKSYITVGYREIDSKTKIRYSYYVIDGSIVEFEIRYAGENGETAVMQGIRMVYEYKDWIQDKEILGIIKDHLKVME